MNKRVRILAPVSLKGRVLGNSYETLAANAGYDREVHGEAIDVWPLLVHMLGEFVSADRAFHAWRRQPGGAVVGLRLGPKTGPGWSRGMGRNGTEVVLLQGKELLRLPCNSTNARAPRRSTGLSRCSAVARRQWPLILALIGVTSAATGLRLGVGPNVSGARRVESIGVSPIPWLAGYSW